MNNDAGTGRSGWRWRDCFVVMLTGSMALGAAGAAEADDNWKVKKGHRHHAPHYVVAPPARTYSPPVVYVPVPPPNRSYSVPVVLAPPPPPRTYSPPAVAAPSPPSAADPSPAVAAPSPPPAADPSPTIIYPSYSTSDPSAGIIRM
jgi:hypothetical protein